MVSELKYSSIWLSDCFSVHLLFRAFLFPTSRELVPWPWKRNRWTRATFRPCLLEVITRNLRRSRSTPNRLITRNIPFLIIRSFDIFPYFAATFYGHLFCPFFLPVALVIKAILICYNYAKILCWLLLVMGSVYSLGVCVCMFVWVENVFHASVLQCILYVFYCWSFLYKAIVSNPLYKKVEWESDICLPVIWHYGSCSVNVIKVIVTTRFCLYDTSSYVFWIVGQVWILTMTISSRIGHI